MVLGGCWLPFRGMFYEHTCISAVARLPGRQTTISLSGQDLIPTRLWVRSRGAGSPSLYVKFQGALVWPQDTEQEPKGKKRKTRKEWTLGSDTE